MLRLRDIRIDNKLSQVEVAQRLNMSPARYNNYEVNKAEPDIDTLIKLADMYNVTVDDLLGRKTHLLNLEAIRPIKVRLIQQILTMNELQEIKAEAYLDGLMNN